MGCTRTYTIHATNPETLGLTVVSRARVCMAQGFSLAASVSATSEIKSLAMQLQKD